MIQERGVEREGKPIELKRNLDSGGNLLPLGFVQLEDGRVVPWFKDPDFVAELQQDLAEVRKKLPLATEKTLRRTIYHEPF